jgi:PTH1 family peptidyl-tRNA hydrolase
LKPGKGHYYYSLNENFILAYSTTFMNNSGIAVLELYENFSLSLENILIVLDDINLPFGKLRLRSNGSDGGHKGLYSIIYHLESENIPRLRIGIGNPGNDETSNWVLSKFSEEEEKAIPEILEKAKEAVFIWKNESINVAMSKINGNQKEVK